MKNHDDEPARKNDAPKGGRNQKAERVVTRAIKYGIGRLGKSARTSTFYFLQNKTGLTLEDFPSHPDEFCTALWDVFGLGSLTLLQLVKNNLRWALAGMDEKASERENVLAFLDSLDTNYKSIETRKNAVEIAPLKNSR